MPLAVMVAGANRHDRKLVEATLESILMARPTPPEEEPHHLCLDAGSDDEIVYETVRGHQ
jgi:putative transposase